MAAHAAHIRFDNQTIAAPSDQVLKKQKRDDRYLFDHRSEAVCQVHKPINLLK
jgi:hypothetical protein